MPRKVQSQVVVKKWALFSSIISSIILCLLLSSCGIPNPPGEKNIAENLPRELTTVIINNPFDETNADVYELEVSRVTIMKRQTNEKEDKVYCLVVMGNEYYEFSKYVILYYNYYDKGGWILDNWEYDNEHDTGYQVLSNPFAEDSVANMLQASDLYDTVEVVDCVFHGYFGDSSVTYKTQVKADTEFFRDEGLRIDKYTFDGQSWTSVTDTFAVSRVWEITGSWSYTGDSEKGIQTLCTLDITDFNSDPWTSSKTWTVTGTFQYQYPRFSPTNFQWWQAGGTIDLSNCEITVDGDTLTILLDKTYDEKLVFSSPVDGEASVVADLGGDTWGGFGTHALSKTISPTQ